MTIQLKAIEQNFHVVLFIMLYKVVQTFKSVDETLVCDDSTESYWTELSCGTVYYVVLFKSVDKTLVCDHSNESYLAVLSCGTVYNAVQGGSNF